MAVVGVHRYRFAAGLTLSLCAPGGILRHFDAEYGPALEAGPAPGGLAFKPAPGKRGPGASVVVTFVPGHPGQDGAGVTSGDVACTWTALHGHHKGTRWDAFVGESDGESGTESVPGSLVGRIDVSGPFGLSLVQSRVIEPLLAVAAARSGLVLLSAAAFVVRDRLVVLAGGPHTGKTSLAARAIDAGVPVVSDDRILVGPHGSCLPFPRRLRAYWTLGRAVPGFVRALPLGSRLALRARAALSLLTRGSLDLPVLLPVRAPDLGRAGTRPSSSIDSPRVERLIVVERARVHAVERTHLPASAAVESLVAVQAGDQEHLESVRASNAWSVTLRCGLNAQRTVLASALQSSETELVRLPMAMPYTDALAVLADVVGLT